MRITPKANPASDLISAFMAKRSRVAVMGKRGQVIGYRYI
jgi:hypothetical protein